MSDMNAVFPSSFELWEFVSSFEDGSLPASACSEDALAAVAVWYLFLLPPAQAISRVQSGLWRNRSRFAQQSVALVDALESPDDIWPYVLRRVLSAFGVDDAVAMANRLVASRALEVRDAA